MHETRLGHCALTLQLEADSNFLIQAPREGTSENPSFFAAHNPQTGELEPTIPATTLRGVLRSTAERILRSADPRLACDPFAAEDDDASPHEACSKRLENHSAGPDPVYAHLCPACRLFGATAYASPLTCQDGHIVTQRGPVKRVGIAIDRFTGGVKPGALYTYHPLDRGTTFEAAIAVSNFALWQLGLLALAFRDLDTGWAHVGSGSRKGMGQVQTDITDLHVRYQRTRYQQHRDARPDNVNGALCDAQALGTIVEINRPSPWIGAGLTERPSASWRDELWVDFHIDDAPAISQVLAACVEQARAPMLRASTDSFDTAAWSASEQETDA